MSEKTKEVWQQQLQNEWNETKADYPRDRTIPEQFVEQAIQTPDRVAAVCNGEEITYAQLNRRANALAHYLRKLGVGPDVLVGICIERSLEMLIGLLGILKAGGAYLPLDLAYPEERLRFMIDDTKIKVLITREAMLAQLPEFSGKTVLIDRDAESISAEDHRDPEPLVGPENLAYINYTSGSTGTPKGVCTPHRAVLRLVINSDYVSYGPNEILMQNAPISFDAATFEIWGSLLNGAKLVICPPHKLALAELGEVIRGYGVTIAFLTTGLFNQLVEYQLQDLQSLRQLLTGGEAMSLPHARRVLAELPACRLSNIYGPTESTTFATVYPIFELAADAVAVPIGRPIANTTAYVLDETRKLCPAGVPGELCIGGEGLARGYWNRPELTAEKFITHPLSDDAKERLYRTGDLVRRLPDGNLEFMGRIDNQVKIRGFRIELDEITEVLRRHGEVQDAVVIDRVDEAGEKQLVAYLVPKSDHAPPLTAIRSHLRSTLPDYMLPAHFVWLPALPLNPNGKVDRRALPAPLRDAESSGYSAPRTQTEEIVADVFARMTGAGRFGLCDNFFEVGGHSLQAMRAVSRLGEIFQAELSLQLLFDHPTVQEFAEQVDTLRQMGSIRQLQPITPLAKHRPQPLSFAQQRLWFLDRLQPNSTAYSLPYAMQLRGQLNEAALERSLQEIVCRHDALRTVFADGEAGPVQVLAEAVKSPLRRSDLAHFPQTERWNEAWRLAEEEAQTPFDLTHGPLFRAHLISVDEQEHMLVLNLHHIVSDGWSMGVVAGELAALYAAFLDGVAAELPEMTVQYADYAVWQREWLQGEVLEQQLAYWRGKLGGELPVLQLPSDRPRAATPARRGSSYACELPKGLAESLKALSRQEGATLYMTLLAAYQTLLGRYSGQDDFLIGSPIAGRTRSELEPLIGFFVNMLMMRADLSGEPMFTELLGRVRQAALGAYAHQDVPFEKLVEALQPDRSPGALPLFQATFALQNAADFPWELQGLNLDVQPLETGSAKFDLGLQIEEQDGVLSALWEYDADLFDHGTIVRMAGHFQTLLEGIAAAPQQKIGLLPLLTAAERAAVSARSLPAGEQELLGGQLIVQAFEAQVERTPDRTAAEFAGQSLTYRELNRRANRLAHRLQQSGVGRGVLAALFTERSLETLIGLLGIFKAGGVYVPLDPEHPQERTSYILEDSQAAVLITQEHLLSALPAHGAEVISLEGCEEWEGAASNPPSLISPEDLAYMIYTSGSTGQPKAVMVEHGSLAATIGATQTEFAFVADDCMPWVASATFDIALFEMLSPLVSGGTVTVLTRNEVLDLERMAEELQRFTVLHAVPSLMRQIAETVAKRGKPGHYEQLRLIFTGGDAVPPELLQLLREVFPNAQTHVLYGPTEGTIICSHYEVQDAFDLSLTRYLIGKPFCHAELRVCDALHNPLPVGVPGELYIGGLGVTRGYYRRDDLTAEKYVELDGRRWYRSGDLVRQLADGTLEFLGRIDNQVKIRGYRIELGEIEAVLGQQEDVREAVVIVDEDGAGNKRLAAYVVLHDQAVKPHDLRAYLESKLPHYMVPSAFLVLESMPLNLNGKVDRRALPAPDFSAGVAAESYLAPRNRVEEQVAAIFADLLGVERVGAQDDFFALGGHSLLATQAVSRLRDGMGVTIPLARWFERATVAAIAEAVAELTETEGQQQTPILRNVQRDTAPVSFAQQGIWFLDRLAPGGTTYHVPIALRLQGELDTAALERSLQELVLRHETLRTTFLEKDGQLLQVIAAEHGLVLARSSVAHVEEALREAAAWQEVEAAAREPFDLTQGPLFRARLVQVSGQEHLLLLNLHHIITDGWSMGVLAEELRSLYADFKSGRDASLPQLPLQYGDYAAWQREWLRGDVLEDQLAYWRKQLSGSLPVLQLPTDRPRPAMASYQGTFKTYTMPVRLTKQLEEFSREEGVTLFMTLFAAFNCMLYRYTGQEDILIGSPIAGRNRSEWEGQIGFFVNMLVMRTDLSGAPTFRDLLSRVRTTSLDAYAHQDVSFEKLVEEIQPDRDLSLSPLFQVTFAMHQAAGSNFALEGIDLSAHEVDRGASSFDLSLAMEETPDGLAARWEYSTDLFESSTIDRMMGHLQTLLEAAVAQPEQPLWKLPMLTAGEKHQLLVEWNDNADPELADVLLIPTFEALAARMPDQIALTYGEQTMTYRELNEQSNRLARELIRQGAQADTRIGISMERSFELFVAILGVLKSGAAYVPLDPSYPPDRLTYMLENSQTATLLTQPHLAEKWNSLHGNVFCIPSDFVTLAQGSGDNLHRDIAADDLAYVIYTSGSTGSPKGVMVTHRGLVNFAGHLARAFEVREDSRFLQFASINFDLSVLEMLCALLSGARLCLATPDTALLGAPFVRFLHEQGITHVMLTPSALATLPEQELPPSLQMIGVGGEACSPELVQRFAQGRRFFNAYGPTEATVCVTLAEVTVDTECVTIGRPLSNTEVYLLDAHLQPVPVGVPGELHVGTNGLARGYLHLPELTQEKFIPHPFSAKAAARLYKTGDMARYLPDGSIDYLGRVDHQVKIRGFRIELGEIEAVLVKHPGVREAVVTAREDVSGNKRLAAYVVLTAADAVPPQELQRFVQERLPSYMVPSSYTILDKFPLMSAGKVDRAALPAPEEAGWEQGGTLAAPGNPVEELLAAICQDVLGLSRISIHDDFFELGGHSLLATQIVSRIRDLFQVELPLRTFFEGPTVAKLARYVEGAVRSEYRLSQVPPIQKAPRDRPLPLSFAQQRLWFLDQMDPNSAVYNMIDLLEMNGTLNVAALEQSLQEIVRRHEVLRTTFADQDGQPVQVIRPFVPTPLLVTDLQHLPETEREERAIRIAKEDFAKPFDLTRDLMIRPHLLRLGAESHLLVLVLHHITSDGWSTGVFAKELAALYEAFSEGAPSPLEELGIQYADFAVWQREWMQGDLLEEQLAFWKQHLSGDLPALQLPTDRPRPAKPSFVGGMYMFEYPAELVDAMKRISLQAGASLFMTLLAAFETLLHRYSGQDDLMIGAAIAGRNRGEIENLIGFFVNMMVLRVDLSGNPSFTELLGRVRDITLGAYAHQDLPLEKLVEELQPERDLTQSPLFRVGFALQNAPRETTELKNLTLASRYLHNETSKFDLSLSLMETERGLIGGMEYDAELFDESTIKRMIGHFRMLLEGIAAAPEARISELPLVNEKELHLLLHEWNDTATDYPRDTAVHRLFEQQAAKTPDQTALLFGEERLSYRELNERANQIAHGLRAHGVGPDSLVALCIDRSLEMVIATLGILKAGGAYVPLDPEYPQERLAMMLQDAGAPVLLTQSDRVAKLPVVQEKVICIDRDQDWIAAQSRENLDVEVTADHLVYVVFTSGSTGRPKGVSIKHRGVARLVTETNFFTAAADDVFLQIAPISFDAATFELWGPLLNGSALAIYPPGKIDLLEVGRTVERYGVTVLHLTAGLFNQMVDDQLASLQNVRQLLTGGDALSIPHAKKALQAYPNCRISNCYGPTEVTMLASVYRMPAADLLADTARIGRPISNTTLYVLDSELRPVPVGVPGELYIGGDGLARGYLHRPELTAERFISDPFAADGSARLYRTGDLVRYLPDGNLEFFGRIDQQVKIRGHRIETGEIEAVLGEHDLVRESAVVARLDETGDKYLAAYVVPDYHSVALLADQPEEAWQAEQVEQWELLFDDYFYSQEDAGLDHTFNITGWNSTYTGEPIPAQEMRVWLDSTHERILQLHPQRVLEIGCGTGLILYGILPHAQSYLGMDISSGVLEGIRRNLSGHPADLAKVQLLHRKADDLTGIESGQYDTVILNSVVQYFPNVDYLVTVLTSAVHAVGAQGSVFVGDVRSLPLLRAFHTAVELHGAPEDLTCGQLKQAALARMARDNELVIDPQFFAALQQHLPQISSVEIKLKRGYARNEMSQFRYDVVLHVGGAGEPTASTAALVAMDWQDDRLTLQLLRDHLSAQSPALTVVRNIPDARIREAVRAAELLAADEVNTAGELRALLRDLPEEGAVEPEDLFAFSSLLPYRVELTRTASDESGAFDAVFIPQPADIAVKRELTADAQQQAPASASNAAIHWKRYANNPLQAKLAANLVPRYRSFLQEKLPEYMVPAAFVVLDHLPLTPNGKIDRKALPAPDSSRRPDTGYVEPQSVLEETVIEVWQEILGVEKIGIHDNFFEIGGHSLKATQVIARLRDAFEIELPMQKIFDAQTAAELAQVIEEIIFAEIDELSEDEAEGLLE
ncbi:hypothetical protein CBW65_18865 [Tumebacillus avium]|uniref:Carrier domain-containing protein n=1 Tax=Tumebacillus avium TaxID=1903704 RepID=A0A1Y0ITS8_9BACL|nr:non-ribosomal peptide synthetase [Tumebacillus avium]ARU62803.1 hypothetical protein CBW65_18865 [Tumebacillus avium]